MIEDKWTLGFRRNKDGGCSCFAGTGCLLVVFFVIAGFVIAAFWR